MSSTARRLQHIAIICDGNRRWAAERNIPVFAGHQHAADAVFEPLIERAAREKVQYVTFWVFSTENWQRSEQEVSFLLKLFQTVFDTQIEKLHKKNVRVEVIGDVSKFSSSIQERIARGVALTKNNTAVTAVFALNYGGRDEILRAAKLLAKKHATDPERATQEDFADCLDTKGIPDPDLIIRTGGEQRLSGFLPWQSVYAELMFPSVLFPDFTAELLSECIEEYTTRSRRFGK